MKGSSLVGILVTFAGYTVASYGYVLIRGWNIPFRQWVSPLNPYIWSGDPGLIPDGQIFPSQANAGGAQSAGGTLGAALAGGAQAAARALGGNSPAPNTTTGNRVGLGSQAQP